MANINFSDLVKSISYVHNQLAAQAGKAVNISLTLRNWMIGLHIAEFELRGVDRATYGDNLLSDLAESLTKLKISNCNRRQLYRYLRFYRIYPGIVGTLPPQFKEFLPPDTVTSGKVGTVSPQLTLSPEQLIERLSSLESITAS